MRLAIGIACGLALIGGVAAIAVNGCSPPQPQEGYCDLDDLAKNARESEECKGCLYANTNTCDSYGACEEAGAGCQQEVANALICVRDAETLGRYKEEGCLGDSGVSIRAAYGSVKESCAIQCGIGAAACQPDPAIPVVSSPSCDTCTTTKCCLSLNSCYESRPCKVAFECFVGCGPEFAKLFAQPNGADKIDQTVSDLCSGGHPNFLATLAQDLPCIKSCVVDYVLPAAGGDASSGPGCQSLSLFACAYHQCQNDCAPEGGSPVTTDAGQDGGFDAGADADTTDAGTD